MKRDGQVLEFRDVNDESEWGLLPLPDNYSRRYTGRYRNWYFWGPVARLGKRHDVDYTGFRTNREVRRGKSLGCTALSCRTRTHTG